MRIIADAREVTESFPHLVLTIGSFDGVHLGHRRILDKVVSAARAAGGTAGLMTLLPHPRQFFSPQNAPNILTCEKKKEALLAEAGIDALFILPFNQDVAGLTPDAFVEDILVGHCGVHQLVVGHDFSFGKGATGDYEFLCRVAPEFGFAVSQASQRVIRGERVSSTLIRECLLQGELERAEVFLGRKYSILGEVVRGRGIGGTLGFPTANVLPRASAIPAHGVYAAEVLLDGILRPAAVNIGVAPTIRHADTTVEAHILGFQGDLAGHEIEIVFHRRLRPEKKFPDHGALIDAISDDVAQIRAYFGLTT